jgi:hypothetical protein
MPLIICGSETASAAGADSLFRPALTRRMRKVLALVLDAEEALDIDEKLTMSSSRAFGQAPCSRPSR